MFPFHDHKHHISQVTLSVKDIAMSTRFYQSLIKLDVISQDAHKTNLGSQGKTLITLIQSDQTSQNEEGLFHVALLLSSEVELANWLDDNKAYLQYFGASDHIVSQAIYLSDPDGHGIEIYADREATLWKKEEGFIKMDTLPLDVNKLLSLKDQKHEYHFQLGHLHLKTAKIDEMSHFLKRLGFNTVSQWHGAIFMSFNQYHHHIACNNWGFQVGQYNPKHPSIQSYTVHYQTYSEYMHYINELEKDNIKVFEEDNNTYCIDPIGIKVYITYEGEKYV
jgi:catechol 2,3-dioxygenase